MSSDSVNLKKRIHEMGVQLGDHAHGMSNALSVLVLKTELIKKLLQNELTDMNRERVLDSAMKIEQQTEKLIERLKELKALSAKALDDGLE